MKIRSGFVSNSSTTSFICEICGEEVSGMDMGLEEAEMVECENHHIFCQSHIAKNLPDDYNDYIIYHFDPKLCPCCNFSPPSQSDALQYCMWKLKMDKKSVILAMREDFKSFETFDAECKKNVW